MVDDGSLEKILQEKAEPVLRADIGWLLGGCWNRKGVYIYMKSPNCINARISCVCIYI